MLGQNPTITDLTPKSVDTVGSGTTALTVARHPIIYAHIHMMDDAWSTPHTATTIIISPRPVFMGDDRSAGLPHIMT